MNDAFTFLDVGYVGTPIHWTNAQMIPTWWGVVVFNPISLSYSNWNDTAVEDKDFFYEDTFGIELPEWINNTQLIPKSWGLIAFNPGVGKYAKWYSHGPDYYRWMDVQSIGPTLVNAQMIPTSWGGCRLQPQHWSVCQVV